MVVELTHSPVRVANWKRAAITPNIRFAASLPPIKDSIRFSGDGPVVISPRLSEELSKLAAMLDGTKITEFKSPTEQGTIFFSRKPHLDFLQLRAPARLVSGQADDTGRIILTFRQVGRVWQLDPANSQSPVRINSELVMQHLLSPAIIANIQPKEANSAALVRANAEDAARQIAVPLSKLVQQFPLKGGIIRQPVTYPVRVHGFARNDEYLQLRFKRNSVEVLIGPQTKPGKVEPDILFECDGLGQIIQSTLNEHETRLVRGNLNGIGSALIRSLVLSVASDDQLMPVLENLMRHAADAKPETVPVPGGQAEIQPGQITLRADGNAWTMQWNIPRNPKDPMDVSIVSQLQPGDEAVERVDVPTVRAMLEHVHVRAQGGFNATITSLYNDFVQRSRRGPDANPFFDPVDQLMAWHVDRNKVLVFGDLDDVLNNKKLPGGLRDFFYAKGLLTPESARQRFGPGFPLRDAIVLGWFDDRYPARSGDVLLLVLDRKDPVHNPPRLVVLPLDPAEFNREHFDKIVTSSAMRTIADAVRYPIRPVRATIGDEIVQAQNPAHLTSVLADSAEQLVQELPQYREIVSQMLSQLELQFSTLKTGTNATIAGIQAEIDELQEQMKREYLESARSQRARERENGRQAYAQARQRASEVLGTSGKSQSGALSGLSETLSAAFTRLRDELLIQADWRLYQSRNTEPYRRGRDLSRRSQAVNQGFRLNEKQIAGMVDALAEINQTLSTIEQTSARMNLAESEAHLLTLSGPNLVAHMSGNGKGYEAFTFDERVKRLEALVNGQIQDYEDIMAMQNTVMTNLGNIMQLIQATRTQVTQLVGMNQQRLTDGHTATQAALDARRTLINGRHPQLPSGPSDHLTGKFIQAGGSDDTGGDPSTNPDAMA